MTIPVVLGSLKDRLNCQIMAHELDIRRIVLRGNARILQGLAAIYPGARGPSASCNSPMISSEVYRFLLISLPPFDPAR